MSYQAGEKAVQYRCTRCSLVSPHNKKCFRCGGEKVKEIVPLIVKVKAKGSQINVRVN